METRLDNTIEEIDITVENRSEDPLWRQDGAYLLGECKNWSRPCGADELRSFHEKLTTKFGRARTGFFFATGGFTSKFWEARSAHKADDKLVIPADRADLERWIEADDRVAVLADLKRRAVFDQR